MLDKSRREAHEEQRRTRRRHQAHNDNNNNATRLSLDEQSGHELQLGRRRPLKGDPSAVGLLRRCSRPSGALERARVVIVGAGLAGLAAAQRLYASNVRDVVVLDALERVGGRVHTVSHSDYLIELGAQWLHGADQNPLYQWLLGERMLDDFEDASLGFKGLFCTSRGELVDAKLVHQVIDILCECKYLLSNNRLNDLLGDDAVTVDSNNDDDNNNGNEKNNNGNKRKLRNARQVFRSFLDDKLRSEECSGLLRSQNELVDCVFEWFLRYETIENCCDTMDDVSISSYTDWTNWGDGSLLNFEQGYRCLLDWFCGQFPANDWIKLSAPVHEIEMLSMDETSCNTRRGGSFVYTDEACKQSYSSPVLVRYRSADGSSSRVIECEHVICTVSLGFLKQNCDTFFKPKLPDSKLDLIRSIGFGTVNKIVLQFERPFWLNGCGFKLVWLNRSAAEDESNADLPEWSRDIISFDVVRRQPNLLIGWIGGRGAKAMELVDDNEIGEVCLRLFERFLPETHARPSKLVKCMCSRWNSNRYICGSYSFQSVSSFNMNTDRLQEPLYEARPQTRGAQRGGAAAKLIESNSSSATGNSSRRVPRVLFAGEATAGKLYSTTHGAIITGWREADRLLDLFRSQNDNVGVALRSSSDGRRRADKLVPSATLNGQQVTATGDKSACNNLQPNEELCY